MNNLLVLMGGLEMLDGVITTLFVRANLAEEANLLVKPLIADGSYLPAKLAGAVICIIALKLLQGRFPLTARLTASAVSIFYALVLTFNISALA